MFRGAENVKPQKERRKKHENRHKKGQKSRYKKVGINFSLQKVTNLFRILVTFLPTFLLPTIFLPTNIFGDFFYTDFFTDKVHSHLRTQTLIIDNLQIRTLVL